jgi:hypothetical protein
MRGTYVLRTKGPRTPHTQPLIQSAAAASVHCDALYCFVCGVYAVCTTSTACVCVGVGVGVGVGV